MMATKAELEVELAALCPQLAGRPELVGAFEAAALAIALKEEVAQAASAAADVLKQMARDPVRIFSPGLAGSGAKTIIQNLKS